MIGYILCKLFGHKFNVQWVDIENGLITYGLGTCPRCKVVGIDKKDATTCIDCGREIVAADDETKICVDCGGMNRLALSH